MTAVRALALLLALAALAACGVKGDPTPAEPNSDATTDDAMATPRLL